MRFLWLLLIPVVMYGAALWMNFWIHRTIGEWMAMGLGVPVMVGVGIIMLAEKERTK